MTAYRRDGYLAGRCAVAWRVTVRSARINDPSSRTPLTRNRQVPAGIAHVMESPARSHDRSPMSTVSDPATREP